MSSEQYFTRQGRKIQGPFDIDRLRRLASLGRFSRGHQVSTDRVSWFPASELAEIFGETRPAAAEAVEDEPDFADGSGFPVSTQPRRTNLVLWIGIPVGVLVLAVSVIGTLWILSGPLSEQIADLGRKSEQEIVGIDDDKKLDEAVGFLVSGKRYVTKDGKIIEAPSSTGSCFIISPSGYVLTNKHVIESAVQLQRAKKKLKALRDKYGFEDVEPILVAFFNGKSYPVKVVYVSDNFDMAIVKVGRKNTPYFRLSDAKIGRRSEVFAFGFPGAARDELSAEGQLAKKARDVVAKRMIQYFSQSDFKYTSTKGAVSRTIVKEGRGELIQHDAPIGPGNSGGPVVSDDGVVYGINSFVPLVRTLTSTGKGKFKEQRIAKSQGIFYSLTFSQMRTEIDEHVPDVVWK